VEACREPGAVGALLRREGLYSSLLSTWRRQRDQGSLQALSAGKRGRKAKAINPLADRVRELELENRKLEGQLKQAQALIGVQKKLCELLAPSATEPPGEGRK
jgi:transposase-like protein